MIREKKPKPSVPVLFPDIQQLRQEVDQDLQRWTTELSKDTRSTLFHGILTSACERFELLLRKRLALARQESPSITEDLLVEFGHGKSWERLTLGECLDILLALDDRHLLGHGRLLAAQRRQQAWRIIQKRNALVHGRYDSRSKQQDAPILLDDLLTLVRSPLFS